MYLTFIPRVLRDAGCKVETILGWEDRGRRGGEEMFGMPKVLVPHHTAGPKTGDRPSLDTVFKGRSDLPGPLCQTFLSRGGVWVVVAAGKANHTGAVLNSDWQNGWALGCEIEAAGVGPKLAPNDYPKVQYDAAVRGFAALANHCKLPTSRVLGHKEICAPKGRKIDPSFDMIVFRTNVERMRDKLNDVSRDKPRPTPSFKLKHVLLKTRDFDDAMRGADVEAVQVALHKHGYKLNRSRSSRTKSGFDGIFWSEMDAAVRDFQKRRRLVQDGKVGRDTTEALGGDWVGR